MKKDFRRPSPKAATASLMTFRPMAAKILAWGRPLCAGLFLVSGPLFSLKAGAAGIIDFDIIPLLPLLYLHKTPERNDLFRLNGAPPRRESPPLIVALVSAECEL